MKKGHVRICQISDLHLPWDAPISAAQWLGKRLLGTLNLKLLRRHQHSLEAFEPLFAAMLKESPDLVVISGDVSNLALVEELDAMGSWLVGHGLDRSRTLVIPGNHDRYTIGADYGNSFEVGLRQLLPQGFHRESGYPDVRTVGPVVVLGLDSAVWRSFWRAAGRISKAQAERVRAVLASDEAKGKWPVIVVHHPPYPIPGSPLRNHLRGMDHASRLIDALGSRQATVLHGHLHLLCRRQLGGLDIIGAPSASRASHRPESGAAYLSYDFTATGLAKAEVVRVRPGTKKPRITRDLLPLELQAH